MEFETKYIEICKAFRIDGTPISAVPFGSGHINGTFLVCTDSAKKYTLQSINSNVFKKPPEVMSNISLVLEHIKKKTVCCEGNVERECLCSVKTQDDELLYITDEGEYYRMYTFVDGKTYDTVKNPNQFYKAAKAFGKFQNLLSDFPAEKLYETIPNFHNTVWRFESLVAAIEKDACGRFSEVKSEAEFALARKNEGAVIVNALKSGEIPTRVTHNDTKLNNILFDENDNDICVIDLDTIMPGSMLYDFGDAIRFGASTAAEDEQNLDLVGIDLELFDAYTKGYLEALGDRITKREFELLAFSAKLISLELGIRFLTDYLEGDTYFKTHFPKQNLYRARAQFKLVYDMEQKMADMEAIVNKYSV